jgi:hypothetical protein
MRLGGAGNLRNGEAFVALLRQESNADLQKATPDPLKAEALNFWQIMPS